MGKQREKNKYLKEELTGAIRTLLTPWLVEESTIHLIHLSEVEVSSGPHQVNNIQYPFSNHHAFWCLEQPSDALMQAIPCQSLKRVSFLIYSCHPLPVHFIHGYPWLHS